MPDESAIMQKEQLWRLLVDTVHAIPMFKNHKRFVEEVMIKEKPDISSKELSIQLNITLGEAIVILEELRGGKREPNATKAQTAPQERADRSILDFAK